MPAKKKKTTKKATKKKAPSKKKSTAKKGTEEVKKKVKTYNPLRGMKDIRPKDHRFWDAAFSTAQSISNAYGYRYTSPPVLENSQLFVRSIGKGTDVVDKEMYVFEDKDGSKVAMRPEFTAGVVRSYISHGMHNQPQPVKTWYLGPLFRHDRPQAGRYRQFHQFGCEVIGAKDPVLDAELIAVAYNYLLDLGVKSEVYINSIGSVEDRQNYIVELVGYLRSKRTYLSEDSKKRLNKNPLRILDSKDQGDQEVVAEAPQIIDWLSKDAKEFFMKVLEYLDELEIPYVLKPTLVRGLDYYSDTVFELFAEGDDGTQRALGGGGRYDGLVEQLGGPEETSFGSGFSIGVERVLIALREQQSDLVTKPETRKVYFAQLGDQARRRALKLIEDMRREGLYLGFNLSKGSLKQQLEIANRLESTHSIILGQKEVQDGTVIIRDMVSGIQETIDQKKLAKELRKLMDA